MSYSKPFLSDEERFRLLDANVTDYAIFIIDTDERIASWNIGAERILGYSEAEIIGQSVDVIFTPEDRQNGDEQKEFARARKTGRSDDERWHLRKDGSRIWALGILTALYDEQEQLRGYAKILRDFTARKQYEERIESLNDRLQLAMTETHHRVKNNLQLISAMIDFRTIGQGDAVSKIEYNHLRNHVGALAAMHEILTADTKAGGDATTISLSVLLDKLLLLLQSILGRSTIAHRLDEVIVATRMGSSVALIVNELVTNAFKYGNGNIMVVLSASEGEAVLSVSDDGPGFPEGFQAGGFSYTGLELIENIARLDLHGEVKYINPAEGGGCVEVHFPTKR